MNYKHLSQKERDEIYDLIQQGHNKSQISRIIGRNRSTIGREMDRNSTSIERKLNNSSKKKRYYLPDRAQNKYKYRRKTAKTPFPLKTSWIYRYTLSKLKVGWSPQMISGRLALEYEEKISHECIYQFVYSKKGRALNLYHYLRRAHNKRRKYHGRKVKRTLIPNRLDISLRPEVVETREEFGHFEGDSIVGVGTGAALHTEVERMSRKLFLRKKQRKTAQETSRIMIEIYKPLPKKARKTTTIDNGCEFTEHETVTKETGIKVYCARPYHSWERGTNENTNGLVRWYYPKKTNFNDISEEEIQKVEDAINNRPRKCLGYKTPNEVFDQLLSACCT